MDTQRLPATFAEFRDWEALQPTKHEFSGGAITAMAGASDTHNQIVANLVSLVRPKLRGSACRVYANDQLVETPYPSSRYPDLVVCCDPRDRADQRIKRHPSLIVEVLSPSTAAVDGLRKRKEYGMIPELVEYVLVDSRMPAVALYRFGADASAPEPIIDDGIVELRSIGLVLSLAEIYEDVDFTRPFSPLDIS